MTHFGRFPAAGQQGTDRDRRRGKGVSLLLLLGIVAVGFFIRSLAFFQIPLSEAKKEVYRDDTGVPYLTDPDSYYYLRMAEQMAETGQPYLFLREEDDPLRGSRMDTEGEGIADPMLLPAVTWFIWRLLSRLFPITVLQVAEWIGPLFGSLAAIPVFLYLRRRAGLFAAAVGALVMETAIPLVSGTTAGVLDTDALLGLIPMSMILCFLRSLQASESGKQCGFGVGCALFFGLLSALWTGYYAYFWGMIATGLLYSLLSVWFGKNGRPLRGFVFSSAACLMALFLLRGAEGIRGLGQLMTVTGALAPTVGVFPSVFLSTGEMQPLPFFPSVSLRNVFSLLGTNQDSLVGRMGGLAALATALAALPAEWFFRRKERGGLSETGAQSGRYLLTAEAAVLLPWLLGSLVLTVMARRMAKIAVLPLAVLCGLGAGTLAKGFPFGKSRERIFFCGLLTALLIVPAGLYSSSFSRNSLPSAADSVIQAMTAVRERTDEKTVLAGWWDDGYLMQEAACRRTLGDGMTDSSVSCAARFFFLARALLTDDPAQMQGILRMLENCGAEAFNRLTAWGRSQQEAAAILLELTALIPLQQEDAGASEQINAPERLLRGAGFSEAQREELMSLLDPEEKPQILLKLGSDLLWRRNAICRYGFWDPATGTSDPVSGMLVSKRSGLLTKETTCRLEMGDAALALLLRMDDDGLPVVDAASDPLFSHCGSVHIWREGKCLRVSKTAVSGPALFLILDGDRVSAFLCGDELKNSMLVRLFVCGDRTVPGCQLFTETYSILTEDEPSLTQRRLRYDDPAEWCTQIWRVLPETP